MVAASLTGKPANAERPGKFAGPLSAPVFSCYLLSAIVVPSRLSPSGSWFTDASYVSDACVTPFTVKDALPLLLGNVPEWRATRRYWGDTVTSPAIISLLISSPPSVPVGGE